MYTNLYTNMNKLLPSILIFGSLALIISAFIDPSPTAQQAAVASAQTTSYASFVQEEVQTKEGSVAYLRVKLNQPATKTTKVTIKLTPDQGTTKKDVSNLSSTVSVTFYKGGLSTKSIPLRTVRTAAEADKGLTATITKVGNTTIPSAQADTARVLITDQKRTASGSVLTGNNGNTGNTTTQPSPSSTNCSQYSGVIPGDTRKVAVRLESFSHFVMPGVDQAGADKISYDLSGMKVFGVSGDVTALGRRRTFDPGVAYAYKFTTSDYNVSTVYHDLKMTEHPGTNGGRMLVSVSECPGDFTSPALLSQQAGYDAYGIAAGYGGTNNRFPMCVTATSATGGSILFGIGAGEYVCNLEKNKIYYLNFTAGFTKSAAVGDSSGGPYTAELGPDGTYNGDGGPKHSFDVESKVRPDNLGQGFGYQTSTGGSSAPMVTIIKGLDSTYQAIYSVMSAWNMQAYNSMQQALARQRTCIAALPANTPYPRPANLCRIENTAPPTPFSWQPGSFK